MTRIQAMSFEDFSHECMEFYRQRHSYFNLIEPEVFTSFPDDAIDREIYYFRLYIGNHATSKILMYDTTHDTSRSFAVYEEWIDKNPLATEYVTNVGFWEDTKSQLILIGEYKTLEECFEKMCTRGESWRWSQDALVHIDIPNRIDLGLPSDDPVVVRTKELLLPAFRYTLSDYIKVLREHKDELMKGEYEVYTLGIGGFRQSFYNFIVD